MADMSFNAISKNKILAKFSKFTVLWMMGHQYKEQEIAFSNLEFLNWDRFKLYYTK